MVSDFPAMRDVAPAKAGLAESVDDAVDGRVDEAEARRCGRDFGSGFDLDLAQGGPVACEIVWEVVLPRFRDHLNRIEFAVLQPDPSARVASINDDAGVAAEIHRGHVHVALGADQRPIDVFQCDTLHFGRLDRGTTRLCVEPHFARLDDVSQLAAVEPLAVAAVAQVNGDPFVIDRP